jgi:predicted alpha/beta superfamily hydrolase
MASVLPWLFLISSIVMTHGGLQPEQSIKSRHLGGNRTVRVYLPPSYDHAPRRRYPVLYLHDGQNVFSSAGTNCCFGWGSWELDTTANGLITGKRMQEIIMVAVDNSRWRYQEYRGPQAPVSTKKDSKKKAAAKPAESTRFDDYAAFLIKELKPRIDREYRTLTSAAHTAVMGSSLGGICSLALAWENPKTFGGAASLSGSFQIDKKQFLENVLRPYQRKPKKIRIYLDSGTLDYTGDDDGRKYTQAVAQELRRIGWKDEISLKEFIDPKPLTEGELEKSGLRRSKWAEAQNSQHNEFYWRQRAWRALVFLFPPD